LRGIGAALPAPPVEGFALSAVNPPQEENAPKPHSQGRRTEPKRLPTGSAGAVDAQGRPKKEQGGIRNAASGKTT